MFTSNTVNNCSGYAYTVLTVGVTTSLQTFKFNIPNDTSTYLEQTLLHRLDYTKI